MRPSVLTQLSATVYHLGEEVLICRQTFFTARDPVRSFYSRVALFLAEIRHGAISLSRHEPLSDHAVVLGVNVV